MSLLKEEITSQLHSATEDLILFCTGIDADLFFQQPLEKWSIAQNVKHLTISAATTRLAFSLPKFIIRLYAGRPNRPSRSYEELVGKYKLKLLQGGKAGGRYIPKTIAEQTGKETLLKAFKRSMNQLTNCIDQKWKDSELDQYIAPHPLLGKITLRELCYFTIYHTQHHQKIIKERITES